MKKLLLCIVVLLTIPVSLFATPIVDNSATRDTLSIPFMALDSIGNAVDLASGDSVYIVVFYPGGGIAFKDSMAYNDGSISSYGWEDFNGGNSYVYTERVSVLDGSSPVKGVYTYILTVDDNTSANLLSTYMGTFQVVTSPLDASLDSAGYAALRIDSIRAAVSDQSINDKVWVDGSPTIRGRIDASISSRSSHDAAGVYSQFTSGTNEDVFKASGFSTHTPNDVYLEFISGSNEDQFKATGFSTHGPSDVWTNGTRTLTNLGFDLDSTYFANATFGEWLFTPEYFDSCQGEASGLTAQSVWEYGTRTLTELDEDNTTIDLNNTETKANLVKISDNSESVDSLLYSLDGGASTYREIINALLDTLAYYNLCWDSILAVGAHVAKIDSSQRWVIQGFAIRNNSSSNPAFFIENKADGGKAAHFKVPSATGENVNYAFLLEGGNRSYGLRATTSYTNHGAIYASYEGNILDSLISQSLWCGNVRWSSDSILAVKQIYISGGDTGIVIRPGTGPGIYGQGVGNNPGAIYGGGGGASYDFYAFRVPETFRGAAASLSYEGFDSVAAANPDHFYGPTNSGSGPKSYTMYFVDTTGGGEDYISGISVGAYNLSQVLQACARTDTWGKVTFTTDLDSLLIVTSHPLVNMGLETLYVAATGQVDTFPVWNAGIPTGLSAIFLSYMRGSDPVTGARLTITNGNVATDTTTGNLIGPYWDWAYTDTLGHAVIYVPKSYLYHDSALARYDVSLTFSGSVVASWEDLWVPDQDTLRLEADW